MKRLLVSTLVLLAVVFAGLPAKAVTITYSTNGSVAQVFLTPNSSGDISLDQIFSLSEQLAFGNTSNGGYGQAFTYIPFSLSSSAFLNATVADLSLTDPAAKPLEWLSLALYEYTGSGYTYLGCGNGSSLCSLDAYDAHNTSVDVGPTIASIYAALSAGTQYLLRVGYGLCGCTGAYGGIQLTVAATPIPPAALMFLTALLGMGTLVWYRRRSSGSALAG